MAKVWRKLQRADAPYTGNVTGTVGGKNATDVALTPITFKQDGVPTSKNIGDIWYDTDDNNIMYFAESVGADQITAGEWVQVKQEKGAISYDKNDVGLGNVTNHEQIQADGSNAPTILKNDQITVNSDGSLNNAGTGKPSPAGIGAVDTDLSNAPNTIKNAQITVNADGSLNNAGSGSPTPSGIGAVDTDLSNAPDAIKNENTTKADVGLSNVVDTRQTQTFRQDGIPTSAAVGDMWIDTNDDNKQYRAASVGANEITSGEWEAITPAKGAVGLSNVANESPTTLKTTMSLNNVENKSQADILGGELTGTIKTDVTIGGTTVNTIKSNASDGATAKGVTDAAFTGNVLNEANAAAGLKNSGISITASGGTVTLNGASTTNKTFNKSSVGLGNVDDQSAATIQAGTTADNVGLGKVVNQKVAVVSGKIELDDTAQTIDADKVGGKTRAETEAAAVSTAETNIIGGAPGTLSTLDAIAAALNDDASFNSTITTEIATKDKAPVAITNISSTPSGDVGDRGLYQGEMYIIRDE